MGQINLQHGQGRLSHKTSANEESNGSSESLIIFPLKVKMSGKLIYSLTEENPDLQKQIGCMNVIFQLFDRQHFISGRRASHKRLPPVGQDGNDNNPINATVRKVQDKNQKKAAAKDKQRNSSESSPTSFSSSPCSSTFSSLECNKIAPLETTFHGTAPSNYVSINQLKQAARQPVDLREVVRESINREACGLSVHIANKSMGSHPLKHIDSPRPMPPSKFIKPKVSNLNESSRTLNKLREAPRFSYDERESREKTTMKPKELPRLSLDSRVNTKKGFNPQEETGNRSSSIVAKLMGLDASSPVSRNDVNIGLRNPYQNQDLENRIFKSPRNSQLSINSPSLKNADSVMKLNVSLRIPIEQAPWKQSEGSRGSPKLASNHPESPKKNAISNPSVYGEIVKQLTDLEFRKSGKDLRALKQILEAMQKSKETVQTKQQEQSHNATNQACSIPSFRDHDRNAKLASERNQPSKSPSHLKSMGSPIVIMKPGTLVRKSNNPPLMTIHVEGLSGLQKLRTGALGDKDGLVDKQTYNNRTSRDNLRRASNRVSTEKNCSPRTRLPQASNGAQQMTVKSPRSPGALSPKLQRRQLILDKQSRSATPSSESSRPIRQTRGHSIEVYPMQNDDQLSDISNTTRCLNHQGDAISVKSESNASFLSEIDADVSSTGNSEEMINTFSQQGGQKLRTSVPRLSANGSMAELATPEQPSPVSVLDAMFYKDDLPSPVKKISYSFQDDTTLSCDEPVWTSANLHHNSHSTISNLSFDCNHKKLENNEHLVQKLEQFDSPRSETPTDDVTSLLEKDYEDHHYISAILLASGLLCRDIRSSSMTIQLHPAGYLLNPDLFLVLEQSYANKLSNDRNRKICKAKPKDNIHRKLVFDVVNEMLVSKVVSTGTIEPWVSPNKKKGRISNGQQLTKDLCTEIEQLQPNNSDSCLEDDCDIFERILSQDLSQQPSNWTDLGSDVSSLVLDIERMIFKDLITEVVNGEATGLRARFGGHSRKLFAM